MLVGMVGTPLLLVLLRPFRPGAPDQLAEPDPPAGPPAGGRRAEG